MLNRYTVLLAVPSKYYGNWTLHTVGCYKTRESAVNRANHVLAKHPTVETRAKRERFPYGCEIVDRKTGKTVDIIEAPIHIVPSVGELGYTP